MNESLKRTKAASRLLATIADDKRNEILLAVADAIIANKQTILEANAKDLSKMDPKNPLYDRLQLTDKRLEDIASDMRNVSKLPSPLGRVLKESTLPNGLRLKRVSVPFGVIGMIYEARPNVTFDVFSLCFKSGNACVLKGGKDADNSNRAEVEIIHQVLEANGVNPDVVTLLEATHEATAEMLNAVGYIDVCIPRGGRKLIDFVRDNAKVPVIETGAGVVHAYFDEFGDLDMGKRIIDNAKTRRVSVCNALDCLIIHRSRLADLPALLEPVEKKNVKIVYDDFGTEFMDYKMAVKVVDSIDEAIEHIATYGSGHSECIITNNKDNAKKFQQLVDAACVYVNAPTSFTDGAQFGLGAEIGISTQKLGPRGPMGLEEITTYKWLIEGEGQIRN
ncbi:MAG: glutamate-5-semialdehyde dehydrogenase [Prevotella sp.]|nr:glutamate-5-semialdehyde dehydrogenase [Prevotellaceae bacterium]MDD7075855.1 glutamate-5-semialdehyde dehydrogenase [Prevotellaceae bacterium]MDY5208722.1 glutamate-5-semialdehyde dehydrogenase [Prevotella sp.]MDY5344441.1 glutamate-5-semialdehyde dehydrogenase [Prevotella sp.]